MYTSKKILLASIALGITVLLFPINATANELILNGGFENGLTGWTTFSTNTSVYSSNFYAASGTFSPISGHPTPGPQAGNAYAVTDQTGPSVQSLLQTFTVFPGAGSVVLTFDMFENNWAGVTSVNPVGLTEAGGINQHIRVDILTAAATALDTGSGVVGNLILGGVNTTGTPWAHYTFDISSLVAAGGTFQLRFAAVETQNYINLGVDNVSINATPSEVPEPATIFLIGTGLVGVAGRGLRRRRTQ
jgi:hypothetical protein